MVPVGYFAAAAAAAALLMRQDTDLGMMQTVHQAIADDLREHKVDADLTRPRQHRGESVFLTPCRGAVIMGVP